jgi:alpha-D-xyloside xylohydrolase
MATACTPGHCTLRVHARDGAAGLRLATRPGERFVGMGERFGPLDLTGRLLRNQTADGEARPQVTSYSPTPFLLSGRGYGLQLETTADATVDLRAPGTVTITVAAPDVVVDVLTGPDPATVLAGRSALIGPPPVAPAWGLGVWKSLIGGHDRALADTDALLAAGVPLDAVWLYDLADPVSGIGWTWPVYGPVLPGPYPDPRATVAALHARGLRAMGYLNPFLVPGRPGYDEAAARGYLVGDAGGGVFTEHWMDGDRRAYLDFTNPAATRWWQDRVRWAFGVLGLDGAMQDYGDGAPLTGRYASGEPGALMRNLYPVLYARAAREAVQSVRPDATVLFARSGYTGAQSEVTGRFTGDQTRDWDAVTGLPSVLVGMLSGSISGWPYWGPDVGGFLDGDHLEPGEERELWDRWLQLGALSPVLRDMLGAQANPLGVQSDAGTLAAFRGYARLHRALVPYLAGLAEQAHATGLPLMRPLWLAHPDDPTAWDIDDQYLLGPDLLVAPVLREGVTARAVYLPAGAWTDYWTGARATGPGWVHAAAPVMRIPLFVADGSSLVLPPPAALGLPG